MSVHEDRKGLCDLLRPAPVSTSQHQSAPDCPNTALVHVPKMVQTAHSSYIRVHLCSYGSLAGGSGGESQSWLFLPTRAEALWSITMLVSKSDCSEATSAIQPAQWHSPLPEFHLLLPPPPQPLAEVPQVGPLPRKV